MTLGHPSKPFSKAPLPNNKNEAQLRDTPLPVHTRPLQQFLWSSVHLSSMMAPNIGLASVLPLGFQVPVSGHG